MFCFLNSRLLGFSVSRIYPPTLEVTHTKQRRNSFLALRASNAAERWNADRPALSPLEPYIKSCRIATRSPLRRHKTELNALATMSIDRRTFLQLLTTGALSAAFPPSIARALSIPAHCQTGTINDVEHIVIMMQENRSFDHYYGTLRGVRGFGDNRAINLPNNNPVWYQPNKDGYLLPFHPGAPNLGLQFIEDLAHDWTSTHAAWNLGKYDQWVPNKGTTTMAHLIRSDIPFHYALADAFTICDAYHCSLFGPTDPNRYYMWTGWVGNDGSGGGPVVDNAEAGYGWSTFPELLQKAGISWKIYQDVGLGLTAEQFWGYTSDAYIGNYGDNSLLYFHQYQNAPAGSPLAKGAKTGTDISVGGTLFDIFRQDVVSGHLPQVSWVVAPEAFTEHPNWPANYGAWYVSQILDALTDHPDVWSKTAFFTTYDENDGFFDHVVPPTVPPTRAQGLSNVDIANEVFPGSSEYASGPYISPWSKGGWVNSQVFDHTSLIRFIERRFGSQYPGLMEGNITRWRRSVSGDLTSAFDFRSPNDATVQLPSTVGYIPPDNQRHPNYVPVRRRSRPCRCRSRVCAPHVHCHMNCMSAPESISKKEWCISISGTPVKSEPCIKSTLRTARAALGPTPWPRTPSSPIVGI